MSMYRGYFVPRAVDPNGLNTQYALEQLTGARIGAEYLAGIQAPWNLLAGTVIPDGIQYKWAIHPDSLIVFNNKHIKTVVERLVENFDDCHKGPGTYSGSAHGIKLDVPPMSILEYFLGETTVHWRVVVWKPFWGDTKNCCGKLKVKWKFWIDDDIDANSFWELKEHQKGFNEDDPFVTDFINTLEGIADLREKISLAWVPFKAQTNKRYHVCCGE